MTEPAAEGANKAIGTVGPRHESGSSANIRKPRTARGWRAFVFEIVTIVIGILIALGLNQWVDAIHEQDLAREARAAIDAEMQDNADRIAYRESQQPCIDRRLKEITGLLADWGRGKPPPAGIAVGDPGDPPMVQQRWQANLNSGRFSRQSAKDQGQQAAFYTQLAILQDMESREHYAWSELRTLELGPAVLQADLRPSLVAALQAARTDASDISQLGQDVLRTAKRAGFTPRPFDVTAIRGDSCGPLIRSTAGPVKELPGPGAR